VTVANPLIRAWKGTPLEERLIALAMLANLLVAAGAGPFPYHDSTNHLARYVLLERAWFGQPVAWTIVRAIPTPYIAVDLMGVGLVHVLGPLAALKVLALLTLSILPMGLYVLLRVTSPSNRGWALVGALLSFSWWYLEGSFNFWMGVGLLFFALALWWPCRSAEHWGRRLLVIAAAAVLLCVHLFATISFLTIVWLDAGLDVLTQVRHGRKLGWSLPRVLVACTLTATCVVEYILMQVAARRLSVVPPILEGRPPLSKLLSLGSPFFALTWSECAIVLGGYGYALLFLLRQSERRWLHDTFIVSALVFLGFYVVSPGTWNIDVRWLPMAYILPFCVLKQRAPGRPAMAVLFTACLLHAGVVAAYARIIRRQLHDVDATLSQLPTGSRLLPLVADHHRFRARPYVHLCPVAHDPDFESRRWAVLTEWYTGRGPDIYPPQPFRRQSPALLSSGELGCGYVRPLRLSTSAPGLRLHSAGRLGCESGTPD
jgi:hypothetical protein